MGNIKSKSAEIAKIVANELVQFRHKSVAPGTTIGVPWSEEKVIKYVQKLCCSLVEPYMQKFLLHETHDQAKNQERIYAEYWVVAEEGDYLEWYDPNTKEFGLGRRGNTDIPVSIGVRGDLVGVYCAI